MMTFWMSCMTPAAPWFLDRGSKPGGGGGAAAPGVCLPWMSEKPISWTRVGWTFFSLWKAFRRARAFFRTSCAARCSDTAVWNSLFCASRTSLATFICTSASLTCTRWTLISFSSWETVESASSMKAVYSLISRFFKWISLSTTRRSSTHLSFWTTSSACTLCSSFTMSSMAPSTFMKVFGFMAVLARTPRLASAALPVLRLAASSTSAPRLRAAWAARWSTCTKERVLSKFSFASSSERIAGGFEVLLGLGELVRGVRGVLGLLLDLRRRRVDLVLLGLLQRREVLDGLLLRLLLRRQVGLELLLHLLQDAEDLARRRRVRPCV